MVEYVRKCMYHKTLAPIGRIFESPEEENEMGDGWVDTPAKFENESKPDQTSKLKETKK